MFSVRLFHLAYNQTTFDATPEGFEVLDNRDNPRPDWYEYWPIRQCLLQGQFADCELLGFFSPRFSAKTGLNAIDLKEFIADAARSEGIEGELQQDLLKRRVYTFCPQAEVVGIFRNPFFAEDFFTEGFLQVSQAVIDWFEWEYDLTRLLTDSRNTVFSNFFIAPGAFWKEWLSLTEQIFQLCENEPRRPEAIPLLRRTNYPGAPQIKVFLIERVATLLLADSSKWQTLPYNPFRLGQSAVFANYRNEALACDALKLAYASTGRTEYLQVFAQISLSVQAEVLRKHKEKLP